jgi:hypothetical protein
MPDGRSFRSTAATVLVYAVAMAFLEAAVVVDLTLALGLTAPTLTAPPAPRRGPRT